MKGKKVVAAIACTALIAAVAVPLAACSGGLGETKLDLSNYAVKYSGTANAARTDLKEVVTLESGESIRNTYGDVFVLQLNSSGSTTYKAINIRTGATIISGALSCNSSYISGYSNLIYLSFRNSNSSYDYYSTDGTLLLRGVRQTSASISYSNGIVTASGTDYTTGEAVTKKFRVDTSTEVPTYTSVAINSTSLAVGDTYNSLRHSVFPDGIISEISDYTVSTVGHTYYFYDGSGAQKSSVNINDGEVLGLVGTYMYYNAQTSVDAYKTSDYNFISGSGKFNTVLHKFDIRNGNDSEINAGLVVTGVRQLLNSKENTYDAAVITGYKMANGVATYGENIFAYIVDKDLKIAYDISWYAQSSGSSSATLYDVGNGYYMLGSYIVDGTLSPVNASGNTRYFADGLINFTENGLTGFTDMEGKVVIKAEYESVNSSFFGGIAYAETSDGKNVFLNKNGTTTPVPDGCTVRSGSGVYYTVTDGNYKLFNFGGTQIKSLDSVSSLNFQTFGAHDCVSVQTSTGTTIYKLV